MDDQAQRSISVSQTIISARAKSLICYKVLYEEKKNAVVQLKLDHFFSKQPIEQYDSTSSVSSVDSF
jgi:hypothetical protein